MAVRRPFPLVNCTRQSIQTTTVIYLQIHPPSVWICTSGYYPPSLLCDPGRWFCAFILYVCVCAKSGTKGRPPFSATDMVCAKRQVWRQSTTKRPRRHSEKKQRAAFFFLGPPRYVFCLLAMSTHFWINCERDARHGMRFFSFWKSLCRIFFVLFTAYRISFDTACKMLSYLIAWQMLLFCFLETDSICFFLSTLDKSVQTLFFVVFSVFIFYFICLLTLKIFLICMETLLFFCFAIC